MYKFLHKKRDPHIKDLVSDQVKNQKIIEKVCEVVRMLQFTELGRQSSIEGVTKAFYNNPMMIYHSEMKYAGEIVLPLINKIINGILVLQDYTLDKGHFKALATSIK